MQWFINDLSLDGQFDTAESFCTALSELLKLRMEQPLFKEQLFCSRQLGQHLITEKYNLQKTVLQNPNPLFKRQVLEWISKSGPFWDDTREQNENDYFTFQNEAVTEQGLGEASRRTLAGLDTGVFSFIGSRFGFTSTPLSVQHGWREPELDFGIIEISNFWDIQRLKQAIEDEKPEPQSWVEVMAEACSRFNGLIFSPDIKRILQPSPFSRCVSQRIFELLGVLQCLVEESSTQGQLSDKGIELCNQHFVGKKAWFSGSSESEKHNFEHVLTFSDPANNMQKLFCPWHGKIKTPQFRIHFEWPRPSGQREIKVVYIGPKLTKK
ncbi:hypothetical protein [Candidatus Venteria ishoeyi]|uniref:Uncharacterized protein n=1 Tax=Candidatus Venteria ishoeyi TaxID=1899563 RepID=A0A1H6FIZ2_9GAMM|nr:hypothetical protein [Candidatus Venteria ishoeyi]SEH09076.1 Uncharacterised protein [Candidatus Venteria ishoeyi]